MRNDECVPVFTKKGHRCLLILSEMNYKWSLQHKKGLCVNCNGFQEHWRSLYFLALVFWKIGSWNFSQTKFFFFAFQTVLHPTDTTNQFCEAWWREWIGTMDDLVWAKSHKSTLQGLVWVSQADQGKISVCCLWYIAVVSARFRPGLWFWRAEVLSVSAVKNNEEFSPWVEQKLKNKNEETKKRCK